MTSWIHTKPLCRLFEMIYPRWHWSTKWGTMEGLSYLYDFSSHSHFAIAGLAWCGIIIPNPILSYWLTNGSVPWDFAQASQQLLAFLRANDISCWTKPWILIPWCKLLFYALHYNGIMVTSCCLWGHKTLVREAQQSTSMEEEIEAMVRKAEQISRFE